MEPAGHQHRVAAARVQRFDQRARAGHRADAVGKALLDGGFGQILQQADPFLQRAFEIEFALHGALGDRGDAILQPREIGELVDAFLPDHGRIHVRHQQMRDHDRSCRQQQVGRRKGIGKDRPDLRCIAVTGDDHFSFMSY